MCKSDVLFLAMFTVMFSIGATLFLGGSVYLIIGQDLVEGDIVLSAVVAVGGVVLMWIPIMGIKETISHMKTTMEWSRI